MNRKQASDKNMKRILIIIAALLSITSSRAQKKYNRIALKNAVVHVGDGTVFDNGLVVINGDKIETVAETKGLKSDYKSYDTVIDLAGKHIYPGLINTNNVLGLHDAEAVRATLDFSEVGNVNPHVRSIIAYNTDNLIIPPVK